MTAEEVWREARKAYNNCPFADFDAPDQAAVSVIRTAMEAYAAEHWTTKGAIKSARELIKSGNALCFAAETSGGTAGETITYVQLLLIGLSSEKNTSRCFVLSS